MSRFSKLIPLCLSLILTVLLITAPASAQGAKPTATGGGSKDDSTDTSGSNQEGGLIRQWASSAEASSEYPGWEAVNAIGEPTITECGDFEGAWASETWDDGNVWLLTYFDTPVIPTEINIHQNFNPGTITTVVVFPEGSDEPIILPDSADDNARGCPHVFTYSVSDVDVPVNAVGMFLDQSAVRSWTEIDAVELVGVTGDGTVPTTPPTGTKGTAVPPRPEATPTPSRPATVPGIEITCPSGGTIENGVEVIINMRPGFSYTATAIGVGAFDPVIAVTDGTTTLCSDDNAGVASHTASLPSTGQIGPSTLSAQQVFTYNGATMGDVSFIVGSPDGGAGSFLLTIEGLAVTRADGTGDGAGDPFVLTLSENLIQSGVDISAYMISVTNALDPLLYIVDSDNRTVTLDDGTIAACDDAGSAACFGGDDANMTGSFITRTNGSRLGGGNLDSYIRLDSSIFTAGNVINYRFSSLQQRTLGDYVAAFHLGTAAAR